MNHKKLLEQAERLTQRREKVDLITENITAKMGVLYLTIIGCAIVSDILMILEWNSSKIPVFAINTTLLVYIIFRAMKNIRKLQDDMDYITSDFYSSNTRRELLNEEINSLSPSILEVETARTDGPNIKSTAVSLGDLYYEIIAHITYYEVRVGNKSLGKFDTEEDATSFILKRIRESLKHHLGI